MLLANYASDSDSENEAGPSSRPAPTVAIPKPSATGNVKGKKRAGPIKITLDLPSAKRSKASEGDNEESTGIRSGSEDEGERDVKRASGVPKGGKGSSALLGMLPPPKRKLPTAIPSGSALSVNKSMAAKTNNPPLSTAGQANVVDEAGEDDDDIPAKSSILLPPSMARKAKQVDKKDAAASLDLFGLKSVKATSDTTTSSLKPPEISSAPAVADFVPPPPTATDPYPGYYQLPGGHWAAYDPEYYHSFFTSQQEGDGSETRDAGRVGKYWADYDTSAELVDVQAGEGLSEARAEEARRQIAKPKKIADEFEYKAIGQVKGLASERHQLSSLLNTAYTQREELEDRIASNKKNARMARTKYGF